MIPTHAPTSKPRCSCARFWTTLGMLILFLCAVIVMLRWNPEPINEDAERAILRTKNLIELQKANNELLENYGWKDQAHGILHIPIERAMQLEITTLNAIKPHAASPIAPIDLVPVPAGMPVKAPSVALTNAPAPVVTSSPLVKK